MGYRVDFIPEFDVDLPTPGDHILQHTYDSGKIIDHHRFSLVFQESRSLALYTAHNIDGATLINEGVIDRHDNFRLDPKISGGIQLDNNRGYSNNPWDRGHLVMRRSLHWGGLENATIADRESFFWSNIVPQHEQLHDTAWGSIEDWMIDLAENHGDKLSVFTGPVFSVTDPLITNREGEEPFQLPAGFWKIFALVIDGTLSASAFLVWQRDYDRDNPLSFSPALEQVRITTIEYLTGLMFHDLRNADSLLYEDSVATPTSHDIIVQPMEYIGIPREAAKKSTKEGSTPKRNRKRILMPEDLYICKTTVDSPSHSRFRKEQS